MPINPGRCGIGFGALLSTFSAIFCALLGKALDDILAALAAAINAGT
jgi:hypothetical protein